VVGKYLSERTDKQFENIAQSGDYKPKNNQYYYIVDRCYQNFHKNTCSRTVNVR